MWCWPLPSTVQIPTGPEHPGAFGAIRRYDIHTGVDLYCQEGDVVVAVEAGVVVAIEDFTGPKAGSPWWNDTRAILIEGPSGVVLYGELQELPSIVVGTRVTPKDPLGHIRTVLKKDKGLPMNMLHLELYQPGTRQSTWWRHNESKPQTLLDPTQHLLKMLQREP